MCFHGLPHGRRGDNIREPGWPQQEPSKSVSQQSADSQALARCRAKAGTDRAEFCEVTDRFCDGEGK